MLRVSNPQYGSSEKVPRSWTDRKERQSIKRCECSGGGKTSDATYCKCKVIFCSFLVCMCIQREAKFTQKGNICLSLLSTYIISLIQINETRVERTCSSFCGYS